MSKQIVTGDILKLKSPADGKLLLALATVTGDIVNFSVVDNIEVQEADGLMSEATYELLNDIEYEIVANSQSLHELHSAEYTTILKHLDIACGPLLMARAIFALKEPGVTTTSESVRQIIDNAILEGEARVAIFSEKIEQFRRVASE